MGRASVCLPCPAGQKCREGSTIISPEDCTAGTYSREGIDFCQKCLIGK